MKGQHDSILTTLQVVMRRPISNVCNLSRIYTILQKVDAHKYLGVTLTSNNKWSKHIDTIIVSASKQVPYLRKVNYRFPSEKLNKLNCTYSRSLLEYASEVWDGCTQTNANRLEQVQFYAAKLYEFPFLHRVTLCTLKPAGEP